MDLIGEKTFEQRLDGSERVSLLDIWGKSVLAEGTAYSKL